MNTVPENQLFIYSSLRKGFHDNVFSYITKYFDFISAATSPGMLSILEHKVVATPGDGNHIIKGELYQLKNKEDFSFVFGQLDDYEGLDTEEGEQPLYRREISGITKDDGSATSAWIYWYNEDVSDMPVIESGDALEYQ